MHTFETYVRGIVVYSPVRVRACVWIGGGVTRCSRSLRIRIRRHPPIRKVRLQPHLRLLLLMPRSCEPPRHRPEGVQPTRASLRREQPLALLRRAPHAHIRAQETRAGREGRKKGEQGIAGPPPVEFFFVQSSVKKTIVQPCTPPARISQISTHTHTRMYTAHRAPASWRRRRRRRGQCALLLGAH